MRGLWPAQRTKDRSLAGPCEDGQNNQGLTLPKVEDPKPAGIGLEGVAWKSVDLLHLPRKLSAGQPNNILYHSLTIRLG